VIGRLQGLLVERFDDGRCILDAGGVGYEVHVPPRTLALLPLPPEPVVLHVHTHVREDAFTLYGFSTREDRNAFRLLITVNGVGPRLALAVLGQMDASELALALHRGEKSRLQSVSGLGRKTAERLLIDLHGKLPLPEASAISRAGSPAPGPGQPDAVRSVVSALVQMGFNKTAAERAANEAATEPGCDLGFEALLRRALGALG
jgi:Holliday junction DNA helicase RuvA